MIREVLRTAFAVLVGAVGGVISAGAFLVLAMEMRWL